MRYVKSLTIEDVEAIGELCFKTNEHVDRIFLPVTEEDDHVFVISVYGNELTIKDFEIAASAEYEPKKYAQKIYAAYMYKKFGDQYMEDYIEYHYSLAKLRQEAEELMVTLRQKRKRARGESNILKDFAGRIFPDGLQNIQTEALLSYQDPEDPNNYTYVDEEGG